jgi:hypothetical protein
MPTGSAPSANRREEGTIFQEDFVSRIRNQFESRLISPEEMGDFDMDAAEVGAPSSPTSPFGIPSSFIPSSPAGLSSPTSPFGRPRFRFNTEEQYVRALRELDGQISLVEQQIQELGEADLTTNLQAEPTVNTERDFFDHAIEITAPFSRKDREKLGASQNANYAEITPVYNFYIKNFETIAQRDTTDERLLPSLYAFGSELEAGNTDEQNSRFREHITLFNRIPNSFVDVVNNQGEKIGERDRGRYFETYARTIPLVDTGSNEVVDLLNDFSRLAVPLSNTDFLRDYNDRASLFPMYFDIRFRSDNSTQFAQILSDSSLSTVLITDILDGKISPMMRSFQVSTADVVNNINNFTGAINSQPLDVMIWDVEEWVEQLSVSSFSQLQDGIFLGKYDREISQLANPQFDLAKQLSILIFNGKLKNLVDSELRTYREILEGKKCYSETVFYEIEKRDPVTDTVIQSFFLPNSNDVDELRFVDTQVKYDKRYTYQIFAYQFILGNKYRYTLRDLQSQKATARVVNQPSLKIARVPYYSFSGRIMDAPPVFPDLNVVPFRAVSDRIRFNLNSNVGVYRMMPQIINDGDQEIVNNLREAQQIGENDPLTYRTDDRVAAFEIYRLNRRPRRYTDFTNSLVASIQTDVDSVSLQAASAASFIDNILPNTKYYYVFRAVDVHGHISNPTPIYEVELVESDGAAFPSIRIVDFDDGSSQRTATKSATRFIQIRPAFSQTILNEQKSGLIVDGERVKSVEGKTNFHLGVQDEQVWDKRFKVRFVSRKTGRKIDLNLTFKHSNLSRVDDEGKILNEGTEQ